MELSLTVNVHAIEQLAREYPAISREEINSVLSLVVMRLESRIVELTPRGVGGQAGLAGSIFGEVVQYGEGYQGVVGTPLEHGEVVELGRRPGKRRPPIEPIALWARRKLGISEKEAKSVAYVIARKIGQKGFEGAHMFQRALDELDPWIMDQVNSIPGRIARRVEGGIR